MMIINTLSLPQKLRAIRKTGHHHLSSLFEKFVYVVESFCCCACSVNSVMISSDHFNSVLLVPNGAKDHYNFSALVCSVCLFPWCKSFYLDWFQDLDMSHWTQSWGESNIIRSCELVQVSSSKPQHIHTHITLCTYRNVSLGIYLKTKLLWAFSNLAPIAKWLSRGLPNLHSFQQHGRVFVSPKLRQYSIRSDLHFCQYDEREMVQSVRMNSFLCVYWWLGFPLPQIAYSHS